MSEYLRYIQYIDVNNSMYDDVIRNMVIDV